MDTLDRSLSDLGERTQRQASCFCAILSTFTLDVVYDYPADGSYS